jgi:hypothetical protein
VIQGIPAYSPDGSKLAIRDMDEVKVKVIASDSGRLLATLCLHRVPIT